MKKSINKIAVAMVMMLTAWCFNAQAQVTPETPGVHFVCAGGSVDVGAPSAGETWVVRYSSTSTDTPNDNIDMDGNTFIPDQTGYYYLVAVNEDDCESEPQEIPIYVLQPLAIEFIGDDYCSEDVVTTEFEVNVTSSDPNVSTYAYQWYIVTGGVESAIDDATEEAFNPTVANPDEQTTYRVRVGYLIGGNKYCSVTTEKTITVLPKPTKPTITIQSTAENW